MTPNLSVKIHNFGRKHVIAITFLASDKYMYLCDI